MVKTSTVAIIIVVLIVVVVAYASLRSSGSSNDNNNKGMVLKAIQISDTNSLDVDRTKMDQGMQIFALTMDTLMTYDTNMNYIPLLAESWDVDPSGYYIDWHLRHDVTFQSGAPFDAYAVKYSIDRAGQPWSVQSDTVKNIEGTEVLDQYTVRVHLVQWDRWLYDWFAEASSSIVSNAPDSPYAALGDDPAYGVSKFDGTGPFEVKSWVRDTKTVLVRNPAYTWGPAIYSNRGPAHLNEIDIEIDPNSLTSEDKFFTGQVDMMIGFSSRPDLIQRLQSDTNVNPNFTYSRSSMAWIGFTASSLSPEIQQGLKSGRPIPANHPVSPLDDTKPWIQDPSNPGALTPDNTNKGLMVRRALLYATNRENMLLYGGWENIGKIAYGPLTSQMWGYNPAVENMYPYDPEMAENLLAQAGYPGGSPTNMVLHLTGYTATGNSTYTDELVELKQMWKQVGIDLTIQELAFDDIEARIAQDSVDIFTGGYTWPNADMLWWYWHTIRVPPSPNRFWWGNAYTDAVIDNTFSINDNVAYAAIQEAQVLIMEDAMWLPVVERPFLLAMRNDVKAIELTPLNNFNWKMLDTYIG
jgi:ABC-type transport system substrate-binding protein